MSTTTLTTNNSISAVTLNSGVLSTVNWVHNWQYTYNITVSAPDNILLINNAQGQPILEITKHGEVSWHGSANQAANQFVKLIQHQIDKQVVGPAALQRSYLRGMEKCLQMAEHLEYSLFCQKLTTEIQLRKQKVMMQELSGT